MLDPNIHDQLASKIENPLILPLAESASDACSYHLTSSGSNCGTSDFIMGAHLNFREGWIHQPAHRITRGSP
jgi:hypothetical protein